MEWLRELAGRRVTVMGVGRFGGGVGAARFLAERGGVVTITDLADERRLAGSLDLLSGLSIKAFHLGGHREIDFTDTDLVIASPAVPPNSPYLELARKHGVPIATEVSLFVAHCPGTVIGVTGSYGKSTTAALIHTFLKQGDLQDGNSASFLGGNIGGSLLGELPQMTIESKVVLELSSFQLYWLNELQWSPQVAVVTSFAPNHLDWHGDIDAYRLAKQAILNWQSADHVAIVSGLHSDPGDWPVQGERQCILTPHQLASESRLIGPHFTHDVSLAIAVAERIGVSDDAIREGLHQFRGLPHRLEFVGEVAGRRFYNDSKATTPEAAIAALCSFDRPVLLLAGGSAKGIDLGAFAQAIAKQVSAVGLMGTTADVLALAISLEQEPAQRPRVFVGRSFVETFEWIVEQSQPGDVVLLSPGCASFDWFRNYEDRGDQFRKLVEESGRRSLGE